MKILSTAVIAHGRVRTGHFALLILLGVAVLAAPTTFAASTPSVITLPAQSVTAQSAVLRGSITNSADAGEILERQIEWTQKSRLFGKGKEGVDFGIIPDSALTVNGDEFFAIENRLLPETAYLYRVLARNEAGYSKTNTVNIVEFTTPKKMARISLAGPLDFGNVGVGQSGTRTLIISNTGNARVAIKSILVPEGFAATFSGNIEAGASAPVTVTFMPPKPGAFGGTLVVKSDAAPRTNTIPISGTATLLAPLPTATTLPAQAITPTSAVLRGVVDSDGGSPILERRIEWAKEPREWNSGVAGVDFGILSSLVSGSIRVSGNEFSATEQRFAPRTNYRCRTRVRNIGGWAEVISVELFATPRIERPIFLSGDLSFGTVPVGESATRTLTISNAGNAALNVNSINLPEGFTTSFSGAIAPTNAVDAAITFAPLTGGPFGGTLKVTSDATSGTTNYFISGTGDAGPPVPLTIVANPESLTLPRRGSAEFQVATAGGQGPIRFQWLFNGNAVSGATSPQLILPRVHPREAGVYSVTVTDGATALVSSNATLRVIDIRIRRQPRDRVVREGKTALLSVSVVGAPPLTYQWFFNGAALEGATGRVLTIPNAQAENAGAYSVHVSNPTGTLITPEATLGVH